MQRRDFVVLTKITNEIDIALEMMKDTDFEQFNSNEILKRAVCMTVINIGELVKSLSMEIRQQNTTIPWKEIAGFRDIAAHKYQTLHMADVFKTVTEDFPELKTSISGLMPDNQ